MHKFTVTYQQEGLFTVAYDLTGTCEIQLAEPDVGIMSAYLEDVCFTGITVTIDDLEVVPADAKKLIAMFAAEVAKDGKFYEWLVDQVTDSLNERYDDDR